MTALLKFVLEIVQDQNKERRKDEWMEGRTDGRTWALQYFINFFESWKITKTNTENSLIEISLLLLSEVLVIQSQQEV